MKTNQGSRSLPIRAWRTVLLVLILAWCSPQARAAIRPSFYLEQCAWDASTIVVVTEGEQIDGVFTVIESWKGNLNLGDTVRLLELADLAPEAARAIHRYPGMLEKGDSGLPTHVSGERMVLFLKQAAAPAAESPAARAGRTEPAAASWESAHRYGDIKVSTVWVEQGQAYAFGQVINPGPVILTRYGGMSEAKMKDLVLHFNQTQEALDETLKLPDLAQRAKALEPFARSDIESAERTAFAGLGKCEEGAVPVLLQMLRDESFAHRHDAVVDALAATGSPQAGPVLTALVRSELEYWREAAPNLKIGWWNGAGGLEGSKLNSFRNHYGRLLHALRALEPMRFSSCKEAVTDLRDFWRSLPQLENLEQMSHQCDRVLEKLQTPAEGKSP